MTTALTKVLEVHLDSRRETFEQLLDGTPTTWSQFRNATYAAILRNPALREAIQQAPDTFVLAVNRAAELGLLPGDVHGHCYLIPRRNKHRKGAPKEVNFQVGYKGLIALAYRHPRVRAVEAHLVYEGEEFEYDRGTGTIHHPYSWSTDRSDKKVIGGYALARVKDLDLPVVRPLTKQEIEERRRRSQASGDGPWVTDWQAMALKTCVIALLSSGRVPLTTQLGEEFVREHDENSVTSAAVVVEPRPAEITETKSKAQKLAEELAPEPEPQPEPAPEEDDDLIAPENRAWVENGEIPDEELEVRPSRPTPQIVVTASPPTPEHPGAVWLRPDGRAKKGYIPMRYHADEDIWRRMADSDAALHEPQFEAAWKEWSEA